MTWLTPEHLGDALVPIAALAGTDSVRLMFKADRVRPRHTPRSWWFWHMVFFMGSYSLVYWLAAAALVVGRADIGWRWARAIAFALSVVAFVWRDALIRQTLRAPDHPPVPGPNGTEHTEGTR